MGPVPRTVGTPASGPRSITVMQGPFKSRKAGQHRPGARKYVGGSVHNVGMTETSKRCCTCGVEKPLIEYNVRRAALDGRQSRCRQCFRGWYETNKVQHKLNVRRSAALMRAKHHSMLGQYFVDNPCVDCGETDVRCLEFDHREGEVKSADVAVLLQQRASWSRIFAEMAKCDVRCANCHRRVTAERGMSWRVAAHAAAHDEASAAACARLAQIRMRPAISEP